MIRQISVSLLVGLILLAATAVRAADNRWSSLGLFGGPVTALAMRPGNEQIVYAGTADGVFRSLDGGGNWAPANQGMSGRLVRALAVDPSRPLRLLAATDNGVFASLDGGDNWALASEDLAGQGVAALVVDPQDTLRVYAGTDQGFYFSDDQGQSWAPAGEGLAGLGVRTLAVESADTLWLYAGTEAGVAVSSDGGLNWVQASQGLEGRAVAAVAVDGQLGRIYAGTPAGLFGSSDRGATWVPVGDDLDTLAVAAVSVDPFDSLRLYVGTDNGVFRSLDGGGSWAAANRDLGTAPIRALWLDPRNGLRLFVGTRSGVFRSLDGGANWTQVNSGLAALSVWGLAADPADTLRLYAATDAGIFRSLNGGESWARSNPELSARTLLVNPGASGRVYAGTDGGVFTSVDRGESWSASNDGLTALSVRALVADAAGAVLFAGTEEGVFTSVDRGESWSASNDGLTALSVRALVMDEGAGRLYAGTDGGIFRSLDGGLNWQGVNAGLTASSIRALAVERTDSLRLYAGTRSGVFRSLDGGDNWQAVETGLTHTDVLAVHIGRTRPQTVYIGTGGGGAFGIALAGVGIDLTVTPSSIRANGEDSAVLQAVVQDAFGGPVKTDNTTVVSFVVEVTEGELEAPSAVVVAGVAVITFTAGTAPGLATVEATAPGLESDSEGISISPLVPEIGLSDEIVDFGISAQPVNKSLVLYNRGEAELVINRLISTRPEFKVRDTVLHISPGDSVVLDLRFEPSIFLPSIEGSLVLITNIPNDPDVIVELKAGSQKPQIQVSVADTLSFSPVAVGGRGEEVLVVENRGTGLLTVEIAPTDEEQFVVSPQAFTLGSGQDTTVVIAFGPLQDQTVEASLGITSDDPDNGFFDLQLKGRGIKPRLDIEPRSLEFNITAVGQVVVGNLILANSGEAELVISELRADDEQVAFELLDAPLPLRLGPGDSTSVQVSFRPGGRGLQEGILAIISTDLDQPSIEVQWSGTGVAPVLEALRDTLDFGAVPVGRTAMETLYVHNRGDVPLTGLQAAADGALFGLSLSSTSMSPGDSAAVVVAFSPEAIDAFSGQIEETLSLASNGGTGEVVLRGQVIDEQIRVYNYPNPVSQGQPTTFWFAGSGAVEIKVFNTAGELVVTLEGGQGSHTLAWDGIDRHGRPVNPGLYIFAYSEAGRLRQRQLLQVNP
ncbi:MAG: choice-of-anchor D domain-containing protein [Candidatus Latescibacteria bacterium]|nr:choice-of-anchor D domain-containing protein [Candidatus Latescibacterota bacterium]